MGDQTNWQNSMNGPARPGYYHCLTENRRKVTACYCVSYVHCVCNMRIICTICTELITQEELESMYITRCGHIFHLPCMIQWINRSPCCPQCREKVTKKLMIRVYPTLSDEPCHNTELTQTLLNSQHQLNLQIEDKNAKLAAMRIDLENSKKAIDKYITELAYIKAEMTTKLVELERQKKLAHSLQITIDKLHYRTMSKTIKMDKKLTTMKDKYQYQTKRNIEWREAAKKKQLELYCRSLNGGCRKRRKNSISSSDSLSDTDSPVSTDMSDNDTTSSESDG